MKTRHVSLSLMGGVAVGALWCVPALAQEVSIPSVSPATSVAQSGQADVHLSAVTSGQNAISANPFAVTDVHLSAVTSTTNRPAWARFASGTGNILFLGVGTLLPLIEDGKDGQEHSLRTADSLLTSTLITEVLKRVVREKRPDSNARDSFPSGHATAAFAVATMQAHYHPKQALLWYAGATAISYSRVKLRRHFTQDVLAGAAIGFLTARFELNQKRGLLLSPFIKSRSEGGGSGVSVSMNF